MATIAEQRENRELAAQIARATEFSAHIRLGPFDKTTIRHIPTYDAACAEAEKLNASSRYGRRAIVYAINSLGSFPCTPELIRLAREINPAL